MHVSDPRAFGLPARHDEEFARIDKALAAHRLILKRLRAIARRGPTEIGRAEFVAKDVPFGSNGRGRRLPREVA